jgi:type I restriction enzyme S subunit
VHFAESDGICSTEFYVLRPVEDVDGRFLAMALRSSLTLAQTRHMMTGNTHPRVVESDAQQLALRVPDLTVQRSLASIFVQRRDEALALRRFAETAWTNAQNEFDMALLA